MKASVIICTRNPRREWLADLARALATQTAPPEDWELLLVDNGSVPPVAADGFPAHARLLREAREGLTPARLRGIRESRGDVLVFFDDDNVPDPDYIEQALALFEAKPPIGVAGGRIEGVFEQPPPSWAGPYLGWLAVRPGVAEERDTGPGGAWGGLPCGAGFCIRADAAARYAAATEGDAQRMDMDRKGDTLTGSGDTDMALTALDMGYMARLTPRLRLRHHIPAARLEIGYLERLLEGSAFSTASLAARRGIRGRPLWLNRLLRRVKRCLLVPAADRAMRLRLERALDRGEAAGRTS